MRHTCPLLSLKSNAGLFLDSECARFVVKGHKASCRTGDKAPSRCCDNTHVDSYVPLPPRHWCPRRGVWENSFCFLCLTLWDQQEPGPGPCQAEFRGGPGVSGPPGLGAPSCACPDLTNTAPFPAPKTQKAHPRQVSFFENLGLTTKGQT